MKNPNRGEDGEMCQLEGENETISVSYSHSKADIDETLNVMSDVTHEVKANWKK